MADKKRVMIFIDGSNHYHIIKDMFKDKKKSMNFDFEKFVNELVGDRELIRVYYYSAPLDRKKDEETYIK